MGHAYFQYNALLNSVQYPSGYSAVCAESRRAGTIHDLFGCTSFPHLCKLVNLVSGHDQVLCPAVQVGSALLQSMGQLLGLLRHLRSPLLCLISILPQLLQLGHQPLHLHTDTVLMHTPTNVYSI